MPVAQHLVRGVMTLLFQSSLSFNVNKKKVYLTTTIIILLCMDTHKLKKICIFLMRFAKVHRFFRNRFSRKGFRGYSHLSFLIIFRLRALSRGHLTTAKMDKMERSHMIGRASVTELSPLNNRSQNDTCRICQEEIESSKYAYTDTSRRPFPFEWTFIRAANSWQTETKGQPETFQNL